MKEGYDLSELAQEMLEVQPKKITIIEDDELPEIVFEFEDNKLTISAVGGHGGGGAFWYQIDKI
jgi:hypothetical protein